MSRYERFDRGRVQLCDLAQRGHELLAADCLPLAPPASGYQHPEFPDLVARIVAARRARRPVILMMGAHPIKLGLSRFIIDLIERRLITHLATNGAGLIHDFELASFGGTSENVARWIQEGQFGLWRQTGRLNALVQQAAGGDEGLGETVGRTVNAERPAWSELSLAAAAYRAGVPLTVHVGIGSDIIHAHPNFDAAAWGKLSDADFLIFAHSVAGLSGGVFLNVGTAVTGPEVFLKALSMARNVARHHGQSILDFTTAVFDLVDLPGDWRQGPPSKEQARYYFRPWKTILARTVAGGGQSYFFSGDHRQTLPTLWSALSRQAIDS
ncbi:MAG: hypothetical protein ABSF26_15930 [Thermoguttaceae bacterium]|jgi:hypothetical protein